MSRRRHRLTGPGRLAAVLLLLLAAGAAGATEAPRQPRYLPYAEFGAGEPADGVARKQAYNEAVRRYNEALYAYHVTLERHDQLVDLVNAPATGPADRKRARVEATSLRTRLAVLRRDVTVRARQLDHTPR